ncbi:MAG: histidine kinase [Bacteroidota bacterium]
MIKKKWIYIELGVHILIWGMYFWLMEFGLGTFWDQYEKHHIRLIVYQLPGVFYLNAFFLIPKYLRTGMWLTYISLGVTTLVVVEFMRAGVASYFDQNNLFTHFSLNPFHPRSLMSSAIFGFILSTGYKFTKDWIINVTVIDRLRSDNLERELAFLKAQVDPHFLFNTLNSLYALALEENSDQTADGIIKLSTLMRYNLHDSQSEKIPVKKEIDYIEKYIALQRLRASEKNKISFQIKGSDNGSEIVPMLLIPFVENAFKYGLNPIEDTFIDITIELAGTTLLLTAKNSIVKKTAFEKSGVGIINVKKRLDLLCPGAYSLTINENDNTYHVRLELKL